MDPRIAESRERLSELSGLSEEHLDLGKAALLIAKEEYPDLDVPCYVDRLDALADRFQRRASSDCGVLALNTYLFGEAGFAGNTESYYDPRNSFLNEVLDRRLGIPITLATLYMEIARRVGVRVEGIGLPGHFLLRYAGPEGTFYIDAFNRGEFLSEDDCRLRFREVNDRDLRFRPEFLQAVTKRQMLTRMLCNLKGIYIQAGDWCRAVSATERILLLNPEASGEMRDRGLLYFRLECFRTALGDLESYLEREPTASDAPQVQAHVQALRKLVSLIN